MKILQILLSTFLFLATTWASSQAQQHPASLIHAASSSTPVSTSFLHRPYTSTYTYHEWGNPDLIPGSVTEAAMHIYSFLPEDAVRVEVQARVELLNSRNFEQFDLRLLPAYNASSAHARLWLWRAGSAAEGLAGWDKLSLPALFAGRVSGMAYPLAPYPLFLTEDGLKLDLLPALEAAGAQEHDVIFVEDLDKPANAPERFLRVLAIKGKHRVFLKEWGQGRRTAYQIKSPTGSTIIFPALKPEVSGPQADGTKSTGISFSIGGSKLEFGLYSQYVQGTRADGRVTPETYGHTVPRKFAFATSSVLPGTTTLRIYKGESLAATIPLSSGGSVDLSRFEDLRPRQFTENNQYELLMTVTWAGREYGIFKLRQGLQEYRLPFPQGASFPY